MAGFMSLKIRPIRPAWGQLDLEPALTACDTFLATLHPVVERLPHLTMNPTSTTFVRLGHATLAPFAHFLAALEANGDRDFFHPHGFDAEAARSLTVLSENGLDEYWLLSADAVLAYGMLRGWAEGFAVPSLGLAVAPGYRGKGLARSMMHHLHGRAQERGARQVRLKVDRQNLPARRLYETLGYVFQDHSPTELLGLVALGDRCSGAA